MKIAIVGSGISGMGAAYSLSPHHDITVYEAASNIGGHSRTVTVDAQEHGHHAVPVDTGFIVFNKPNYPLLTTLFEHLDVPIAKSDMSFGVSIHHRYSKNKSRLEYGSRGLSGLFAQKRNIIKLGYWAMLRDIIRFNRLAPTYLNADVTVTLDDALTEMKLGNAFKYHYLLPMGASIWSTPTHKMLAYPACTFLRFFKNHGLLTIADHPQWYTVQGGSKTYVSKLTAAFQHKIKLRCGVTRVERLTGSLSAGVKVTDAQGHTPIYDQIIFACHADQALALLTEPSTQEQAILSQFHYQKNRMVLHGDPSLMPETRAAWSSWVYRADHNDNLNNHDNHEISLSYWMNNLQPLKTDTPIIVTLNPDHEPSPNLIYDEAYFSHPIFDTAALIAQSQLEKIQGVDRIWFCGAYQRYGFHEDGLWSAVNVAKKLLGNQPNWLL